MDVISSAAASRREEERLRALHALDLLDSPAESEFTDLVQLASEICSTPMGLVSLVDRHRQWFKAKVGCSLDETGRDVSFCAHAIQQPGLFIVKDASKDPRFEDNALVTGEPGIRFYAGIPLTTRGGAAIGTLCILDTVPRTLSRTQKRALSVLGRQLEAQIDLREQRRAHELILSENEGLVARLRSSEDLFRAFIDNGPGVSYIKDQAGRLVYYNQTFSRAFHISATEWIGLSDGDLWPDEMASKFRKVDLEVLRTGQPVQVLEVSPGFNGETLHWKSTKFRVQRENGDMLLAGTSVEVTDEVNRQKALEQSLREKEELARSLTESETIFHTFMNNTPNITFLKDEDGRYLFYNRCFAEHFGVEQDEWLGKTDHEIHPKAVADAFRAHDLRVMETGRLEQIIDDMADAHGETLAFRSTKFLITNPQGKRTLAGVAMNITDEVRREKSLTEANTRLEHLATTDSLTGLSNRSLFEIEIAKEFAIAKRKKRPLSVVMMDIDHFKLRNDQCGHAAGDDAIRLLGKILLENTRLSDVAARIGGEEFCCILPDTDANEAKLFAERIRKELNLVDHGPLPLTVSIGVTEHNKSLRTWERMIAQADDAMYEAKRSGRDRIVVHSEHILQLMKQMDHATVSAIPESLEAHHDPAEDRACKELLSRGKMHHPVLEEAVPRSHISKRREFGQRRTSTPTRDLIN